MITLPKPQNPKISALIEHSKQQRKKYGPLFDVFIRLPANQINFFVDHLHVSPAGMRKVGEAILVGSITVERGDTGSHLGAAYTPHKNILSLSHETRIDTIAGRAAIFHEGVHALVDMKKIRNFTALQDEVAGYLGDALYMRILNAIPTTKDLQDKAIYDAAYDIIERYQMRYKPGVKLTAAEYAPLAQALKQHGAYGHQLAKQKASADGIPMF